MKLKLQEYALIAEIISAIAIVLSLIFVGLQVKQGALSTDANTRAVQGQAREAMLAADMDILRIHIDYPFVYMPAREELPPLTAHDWEVLRTYTFMMMRTRENYWVQHQNGMLDDATYESYMFSLASMTSTEIYGGIWDEFKDAMGLIPEFIGEIEQRRLDNL